MAAPWESDTPAPASAKVEAAPWEKSTTSKSSAPWDQPDDGRSTFNKVTGWDNFDVADVPKKTGAEALALADLVASTPSFLLTTAERVGGMAAKTLAPVFGKDKASIDRETDKLVHQTETLFNEPIKNAGMLMGMNRSTFEDTYVSKGMQAFGEGKDWVDEKLAGLTGVSKRDVATTTDVLTIPLGELIHKGGSKVVGKVTDKLTEPTAESVKATREKLDKRSEAFQDYQEKKTVAEEKAKQQEFDFAQTEKTKAAEATFFDENPVKEAEVKATETSTEPVKTKDTVLDNLPGFKEFREKFDSLFEKKTPEQLKDARAEKALKDIEKTGVKSKEVLTEAEAIAKQARQDAFLKEFQKSGVELPKGVDPLDPMKNPNLFRDWSEGIKDAIGYNINATIADKRIVNNIVSEMVNIVPDAGQRSAIWEAFQRGTTDKLTGASKQLADYYAKLMDVMGKEALEAGVIKGLIDDYATRIIDMSKIDPATKPTLLANLQNRMSSFPTTSRFGKSRMSGTFDQFVAALKEAGLELKTTDLAEVFREYATSMNKAMENQKLIDRLKEEKLPGPDGFGIFLDTKKGGIVPSNYIKIETGQFAGYAVHPEVYPALKFVMDARDPGMIIRAASTLNSAIKRLNISMSFFHGSSLSVASLFANSPKDIRYGNMYALIKEMRDGVLKEFHEGGLGDSVDRWLRQDGLGLGVSEDVGKGSIKLMAETADRLLQKYAKIEGDWAQKGTKPATWFQEKLDYATWNVLHDGLKLLTAEKYLEKAKMDHPNVPEAVLRKEIAQAVNNIYGGLDWFEMARNPTNKFAEAFSMAAFSPEGRRALQILMFAPDWTISTVRAFTEAIPKNILKPMEWDISKGLSGLQKPLTRNDYARRYQMRFAVYYLTLFNAINMALSGHPIWENEDKTTIDMGDGRTMAMMKHPMEPFHWMSDFDKTLANKLGFVPKATIKTTAGVEYPSPNAPKLEDLSVSGRLKSLAKDVVPFSAGSLDKGWQETLSGFMGLPIRGMTPEQKAVSQAERAVRRAQIKHKQTLDKREDE